MIHLDAAQVAKDVIVVRSGAFARKSRTPIRGVGYTTYYCWGCELIPDIRKIALRSALERAKIPFSHGGRPGETLP
jgi:hypothetical protein